MTTDEIIQGLLHANATLGQRVALLERNLALALLANGGQLALRGAPTSGYHHIISQHRCAGRQHGPGCVDVLEAHPGRSDNCCSPKCQAQPVSTPSPDAAALLQRVEVASRRKPYTPEEQQRMLAAEARQHPNLN